MDDRVARKVSTSMKNAITANSYRGHALGKTVKKLEVEKDLKMLSLQVKTDQVRFSSTSPKPTRKKGLNDNEELDDNSKVVKMERKGTLTTTQRPHLLPLIRSNSTNTRRDGFAKQRSSTTTSSSPPSPNAAHANNFNFSSPLFNDVNKEKIIDDRRVVSTRLSRPLSRNNTASPILTAKFPKPDPGSSPPGGVLVHRGLALKPISTISTSKQPLKSKQNEKAKTVFSRLYQVQATKPKKSIAELMEGAPASPTPRLDRRRRSISMPDLSDAMEDLRNCRYLRKNSKDDS